MNGGRYGFGSDRNIRISLTEDVRIRGYSHRLPDKGRVIPALPDHPTGPAINDADRDLVQGGRHMDRAAIIAEYRAATARIQDSM